MKHPDGLVTTVPEHRNDDLPKGLLKKIIREDIQMEMEEFNELFQRQINHYNLSVNISYLST